MTYPHRLLLFAAVFGFIAVVMGTLAEHVFRASVDEEQFRYLMTAVRYLQVHSAVLLALALALLTGALSNQAKTGLRYSFVWLITGTTLFGGSIFIAVGTGVLAITYLTPVGGTLMMIGWLQLAWTAWRMGDA